MVLHSCCYHIFCCECVKKKEKPMISKPFGLNKPVDTQTNLSHTGNKYDGSVYNGSLNYKTPITRQPISKAVTTTVFIPKTSPAIENESNNLKFLSDLQDTAEDAKVYIVNDGISAMPTDELEQDNLAQTSVSANEDPNEISNATSETVSYAIIENDDTRISASRSESELIVELIFVEPELKQLEDECLNNTITDDFEYRNAKIENIINEQNIDLNADNQEKIAVPFPSSKLAESTLSTYVPVYGKPTFIVPDKEVDIKFHLVANNTNQKMIKSEYTAYTHKPEGNCEEIRPS